MKLPAIETVRLRHCSDECTESSHVLCREVNCACVCHRADSLGDFLKASGMIRAEGWTVGTLIALLQTLPQDTRVLVFSPFDGEGPCDWVQPRLSIHDGVVRIEP